MLCFENVTVKYGDKTVLDGFSAELSESRIIVVKGPSGCGKTTLLSVAAGIVKPCKGRFVCDKKISVMFQEPQLFPWLTARENITAVLHDCDKNSGYAERILESVGISEFDKYPGQLSGGMKQRVSFARALAYDGELLLLDEPFSALDAENRRCMLELLAADGRQVMFVTHDDGDIYIADKIIELK